MQDYKWLFSGVLLLITQWVYPQQHINSDTIRFSTKEENLLNRRLFGDSLCSSFCIMIRKEVKLHKHLHHSEHIVVQEGEALMTLGEKQIQIKKGDVVFIPENTYHSVTVTSKTPLKVISIQSPFFDGTDRVYK